MPYDHRLPAYVDFWKATHDKARRLLQQPQHLQRTTELFPSVGESLELAGLPNFDLFSALLADAKPATALVLVFVFGVPFAELLADDALYANAAVVIGFPSAHSTSAGWSRADAPASSRHYGALALRLRYLAHLIDKLRGRLDELKDVTSRAQCLVLERAATQWREAHVMLTLAIDHLGYVPADDRDPVWAKLCARYSPDVNMFLHMGEMPDVREELYATPILKKPPAAQSTASKLRSANPVLLAFTKVCPRRCGMRDLVEMVLDYALRNVSSLYFFMLVQAASYLGIYRHCRVRPELPMIRDVYELFFFELAPELVPHRRFALSEATALYTKFEPQASDVHIYIARGSPRVRFSGYESAVRTQYRAAGLKVEKASTEGKPGKKKKGAAAGQDGQEGGGGGGTRSTSRQRAEAIVPTTATTQRAASSSASSSSASTRSIAVDDEATELHNAIALSNATARLEFDRQCGYEAYEQRRAANTLPSINGVLQEFVAPTTSVTDIYAYRRIADCDRQMPSAVDLARRQLVFRQLSTLIEYDSMRPADATRATPPSKEYPCTWALTQQIREFMFALLDDEKPLRDELHARVPWHQWQLSVVSISDLLRQRLSAAHDGRVPFNRRFELHHRVSNEPHAPTNNLYTTENPPFVTPLYKAMTSVLQSPKFLALPVDRVAPREIRVAMNETLRFYNYPRSYAESSYEVELDELASTTVVGGASGTLDGEAVPAYIETVTPALPPFGITLTKELPPDDADEAWIQENMVRRLLFPGRQFHLTADTIDLYNRTFLAYCRNDDDNPKMLSAMAWQIAHVSVLQFMLLYSFVGAVETYLSVFTLPVPRHIVDQQMRVMCARYGCAHAADIPRHARYSLVCLACRRFAGFLATPKRPNMQFAEGTGDVRTLERADDQVMLDRIRQRGRLLAPDEMSSASSMYDVFEHRALYTTDVYDQYTIDAIDRQLDDERRARGYYEAATAYDPWHEETLEARDAVMDRLYASSLEREAELRDGPALVDWRCGDPVYAIDADGYPREIGDDLRGEPLPPMRPVATDGTFEAELAFRRRVRDVYDRLMGGRFLLMGQRLPTPDDRPYSAATDSRRQIRQKLKNRKAQAASKLKVAAIADPVVRKREWDKLWRRCCRDVTTLVSHVHCSNELMQQYALLGNALVIVPRGRTQKSTEIIVDCCGCATSVLFNQVVMRGAWWFCPVCMTDGTWLSWMNGGAGPRGLALNGIEAIDVAPRDVALPLKDRLSMPGRSWLPDSCVRQGEKCAHPKCKRYKSPTMPMISKEVVFDLHGKERTGYVSICRFHQRDWMFTLPFVMTRSMLGVLLCDNDSNVSTDDMRTTDYLSTYMTRLADLTNVMAGSSSSASAGGRARKSRKKASIIDPIEPEVAMPAPPTTE
jgi:hypothetical protein